jgi:hypothetical protein
MGPFSQADEHFVKDVVEALLERRRINCNRSIGRSPVIPRWEDDVSPTLFLSSAGIKQATGRTPLRGSVYGSLEKKVAELLEFNKLDMAACPEPGRDE